MGIGKRKAENDHDPSYPSGSSFASPGEEPKPKRQKTDPNAEKRLARFKSSCPKNIMDRVDRVMTQRFFMVDRERVDGQLREIFKVLGTTGNVYTIVIDKIPSCNCPDATKGNHCKHILFIFLKVLSVSMSSNFYYQKALLSTELETVFAHAPAAPNSLSHPRVKAAYAKAMGRPEEASDLESKAYEEKTERRLPGEDDDCPICYESMHDVKVETLTFCGDCGNALHTECFKQWARTAKPLTCVWCRAKWPIPSNAAASGSTAAAAGTSEGYLNLGAAAGVSPVRDTSSYYKGPRHGQPWYGGYGGRYY